MPDYAKHKANRRVGKEWLPQPDPQDGTFQFTWALADLTNPLRDSGMVLRRMVDLPAGSARFWQDYSYKPAVEDFHE